MSSTVPAGLVTEFSFELPKGYVDGSGGLHRHGTMRLATARDEILPLRDPRVRDNDAYLTVLLLSRVVTGLGTLSEVNPGVIEGLFTADLVYLQALYRRINIEGRAEADVECPHCAKTFVVDLGGGPAGGS